MVSSADVPAQFVPNWKPYSRAPSREASNQSSPKTSNKLCLACDECRQARVKCSGGNPCRRCRNDDGYCHYSVSKRSGRTKAVNNKKRQNNNTNSNIKSAPPPTTVDNSQKNPVRGNASIDHSVTLDDFSLLNAMDSSSSNAELTSDSSLRDLFPVDFDSLDFGSIFSSANSSGPGISVDPPFPRPLSASRLHSVDKASESPLLILDSAPLFLLRRISSPHPAPASKPNFSASLISAVPS